MGIPVHSHSLQASPEKKGFSLSRSEKDEKEREQEPATGSRFKARQNMSRPADERCESSRSEARRRRPERKAADYFPASFWEDS